MKDFNPTLILSERESTPRQKAAVKFCELVFPSIIFKGDIDNFREVSAFLNDYLEDAKETFLAIKCEYDAYIWSKF